MALFGKKKSSGLAPGVSPGGRGTTRFGGSLTVVGTVSGEDDLHIEGTSEGKLDLKGALRIDRTARVKGEAAADAIDVSGRMDGVLTASTMIHLGETARITGAINTPRLSVSEGAAFDGEVHMKSRGEASAADKGKPTKTSG
ncbi:MAG: polymer-forming cytoskeletal protein [Desulfobacterales bacterium]|nr:polymer-forming cytoskeletal protein [Desulfobacterales bacterium]